MSWNFLRPLAKALVIAGVVAYSLWACLPVDQKIHLGLDLQGGSRLLLQLSPTSDVKTITPEIQAQTHQVIEQRIDSLGVTEPQISNVGSDRLLVEIPNLKNPDQAEQLIKQVAVLEYKIMPQDVEAKAEQALQIVSNPKLPGVSAKARAEAQAYVQQGAYAASGDVVYTGKELQSATAGYDQSNNPDIQFVTKNPSKFYKMSSENLGKLLAIFLDHRYVSAATIQGAISSNGQITGSFTQEQTVTLANELNAGALPASISIIEKDDDRPDARQDRLDAVALRLDARARPRADLHDRGLSPARLARRLRARDLRDRPARPSRARRTRRSRCPASPASCSRSVWRSTRTS